MNCIIHLFLYREWISPFCYSKICYDSKIYYYSTKLNLWEAFHNRCYYCNSIDLYAYGCNKRIRLPYQSKEEIEITQHRMINENLICWDYEVAYYQKSDIICDK